MNSAMWVIYAVLFLQIFVTLIILFGKTPIPKVIENAIRSTCHRELAAIEQRLDQTAAQLQMGCAVLYQKKAAVMEELYIDFEETSHRFQLFAYNPDIDNCQYALDALVKTLTFFATRRVYFEGKLLHELELVEKFFNESCSLSRFYVKDVSGEQYKDRIQKYLSKINNQVLPGILRTIEDDFQNMMKGLPLQG